MKTKNQPNWFSLVTRSTEIDLLSPRAMKRSIHQYDPELQMIVVFRRVGQRRYAIEVKRAPFPDLEMNPAPGYDAVMPHDLLHLVVEAQLGLTRGVFGQLAAGGDAGTFHPSFNSKETSRATSRIRKRVKARGKKLMQDGRDEAALSEQATFICWYEWLSRSQSSDREATPRAMAQQVAQVRDAAPAKLRALSKKKLEEICRHMDKLSSRWSSLEVGQSMTVRWPDLALTANSD